MKTVQEHINSHCLDVKKIDNYNRKNFIIRYNKILEIITLSIVTSPEKSLHKDKIKKFIMGKFILSEVATKRYLLALESSDAFVIEDSVFKLPEDVTLPDLETKDGGY